jgi:hypothetical protein
MATALVASTSATPISAPTALESHGAKSEKKTNERGSKMLTIRPVWVTIRKRSEYFGE